MRLAYYPGCSLHSMETAYDHSVKAVCKHLGIDLWEIPDWVCCGASSAHSIDHLIGLAIPAKTLVKAEKEGLDVMAPCAACWQRLVWVNHEVNTNTKMKEKISKAIGEEIKGTSKVLTIMEAIASVGTDKIAQAVKKPLTGLKVASYYGCYYVKPPKLTHVDDPENPQLIDNLMKAIGAEAVDWPFKTECCGTSLIFQDVNTTLDMSRKVIDVATKAGAEVIVTACPVCEMNLDMRMESINKRFKTNYHIPVVYFTELMAVALGSSPQEVGIDKGHCSSTQSLLAKIG
ncbi:MAG: CoB--CoM heterodisulfide reductase iron-sulfur subunit B family protein [Bacillota bacterium]